VIEPLLPNKPRGVLRVDDRRVLNGILWVLRSGAPWRTCPSAWSAHDSDIQMIDSTSVRAHQQSATAKRRGADHCLGRSRGGLTTRIHVVVDAQGLPRTGRSPVPARPRIPARSHRSRLLRACIGNWTCTSWKRRNKIKPAPSATMFTPKRRFAPNQIFHTSGVRSVPLTLRSHLPSTLSCDAPPTLATPPALCVEQTDVS